MEIFSRSSRGLPGKMNRIRFPRPLTKQEFYFQLHYQSHVPWARRLPFLGQVLLLRHRALDWEGLRFLAVPWATV